jgi:hypothetical protein
MTRASVPATAEQLDEVLDDEGGLNLYADDLTALRAMIARGRAASEEECISAEEALAELDAMMFDP